MMDIVKRPKKNWFKTLTTNVCLTQPQADWGSYDPDRELNRECKERWAWREAQDAYNKMKSGGD
jgi:hypothetical protein